MLVARSFARGVGRNGRAMSSIVEASPRATIAQNIVAFNKIAHAHDDSALAAATQAVKIDVNNLQPELEGLQGYLTAGPVAGTAAFVKDPSAWQNMAVGEYVSTEAGRADTWPFLVGGIVTFILLGVGIPMGLSKEGRKNSKYISMIEGRHGELGAAHGDHGHDAHHH